MTTRLCLNVVWLSTMAWLVASCHESGQRADLARAVYGAPPELQTIGERAQQLMAAAADDNWPQIHTYVKDINDAWLAYKYPTVAPLAYPRPPAVMLRGPLDGAMFRLKFAHDKGQAQEIMKAAGEIDAAALKLLEYYTPTVPLDLRRLRMLEGQVLLSATQNRIDPASDTLKEVYRVWERVRPEVEARSSADAVGTFEECLAAQQAAVDQRDYKVLTASARQGIDRVNEMLPLAASEALPPGRRVDVSEPLTE